MFWAKTSSVSNSFTDIKAQIKIEDKPLANPAKDDFNITKGAVWFKLLGLSSTNQSS